MREAETRNGEKEREEQVLCFVLDKKKERKRKVDSMDRAREVRLTFSNS